MIQETTKHIDAKYNFINQGVTAIFDAVGPTYTDVFLGAQNAPLISDSSITLICGPCVSSPFLRPFFANLLY